MLKVTIEQLTAMKPCNLPKHIAMFGKRESLTIRQAIKAGATVSDILWVIGRLGPDMLPGIVAFANFCAAAAAADEARYAARYAIYAAADAAAAARYAIYAAADAAAAARYADAVDTRCAIYAAADAAVAARYAAVARYANSAARHTARYAAVANQLNKLIEIFGVIKP